MLVLICGYTMLAERKKRVKWSLNPRGNLWSQDTSKYGQQMLEKMGWKPGCGLGANEQGITEHIKVAYKSDKKCIGYKEHGDEWLEQQSQFEKLLAELGSSHGTAAPDKRKESLELRSQQSRARVHYHKFTRGKDVSNYSDKDLACILGVKKPSDIPDYRNVNGRDNYVDTMIGKVDSLYGITTVNGGNMNDYFIKKKYKNVDAAEENQAEFQCEKEVGMELGESVHEAQTETKKKQSHKNTESSDMQRKDADGLETKEYKLVLNTDSTGGSKYKKKKRKLEQEAKEGKQLLQDDERGTTRYCEKNAFNFDEKDNIIKQEYKRKQKKKQKENPDMERQIVRQNTDGNEMNDNSANYLNYKTKKRKFQQEAKEHLLKEEEIIKEDRRSIEASYTEKDMYSCEVEDSKIKKKKKQKEKYNESPEAYGGEVETQRSETTLLNDDSVNGLNCNKKKRKLKKEVKERIEDEIIEQGKTGRDDVGSCAPAVSDRSEKKCEKKLLQENSEFVNYQVSIPAGDMTMQKKDSFKKLKNGKKSIYRDTEKMEHCEMKDNEIVQEEAGKHKIKKKKTGKFYKDGSIHDIQDNRLVEYNLEEPRADSKKCEELSQNVEGLKKTRNNPIHKQDVCNSNVKNSAGANRTVNFGKTDVNRRKMRPSVFAQLVDPSLIEFRGSNLCMIPGYGHY